MTSENNYELQITNDRRRGADAEIKQILLPLCGIRMTGREGEELKMQSRVASDG